MKWSHHNDPLLALVHFAGLTDDWDVWLGLDEGRLRAPAPTQADYQLPASGGAGGAGGGAGCVSCAPSAAGVGQLRGGGGLRVEQREANVYCAFCSGAGDDDLLLLCDECGNALVSMRESLGANLAFMLMNSFATSADTLGHLSK
ncbi:hypothetical protein T492DRAFT_880869 [Pavlovales sp. CCMP2436]|nr:hypothetical protein T492DRAFT_880869 [Pavlovales sp. CCMP2436]